MNLRELPPVQEPMPAHGKAYRSPPFKLQSEVLQRVACHVRLLGKSGFRTGGGAAEGVQGRGDRGEGHCPACVNIFIFIRSFPDELWMRRISALPLCHDLERHTAQGIL